MKSRSLGPISFSAKAWLWLGPGLVITTVGIGDRRQAKAGGLDVRLDQGVISGAGVLVWGRACEGAGLARDDRRGRRGVRQSACLRIRAGGAGGWQTVRGPRSGRPRRPRGAREWPGRVDKRPWPGRRRELRREAEWRARPGHR